MRALDDAPPHMRRLVERLVLAVESLVAVRVVRDRVARQRDVRAWVADVGGVGVARAALLDRHGADVNLETFVVDFLSLKLGGGHGDLLLCAGRAGGPGFHE